MSSENGHPAERTIAEQISDINEQVLRLTSQLTALMQRKKELQRKLADENLIPRRL